MDGEETQPTAPVVSGELPDPPVAVLEVPPKGETAEEAKGEPTETKPVDEGVQLKEAQVKLKDAEQRASTAEGRLRKQGATDGQHSAQLSELLEAVDILRLDVGLVKRRIANPDADPETFRQAEEQAQQQVVKGQAARTERDLLAGVYEVAAEESIDFQDPKVMADLRYQEAANAWNEAVKSGHEAAMYKAASKMTRFVARLAKENEQARLKEEAQEKVDKSRKAGNLAVDTGKGVTAPAGTDGQIWEQYGRGEIPWSKRVREAGKAVGAAV